MSRSRYFHTKSGLITHKFHASDRSRDLSVLACEFDAARSAHIGNGAGAIGGALDRRGRRFLYSAACKPACPATTAPDSSPSPQCVARSTRWRWSGCSKRPAIPEPGGQPLPPHQRKPSTAGHLPTQTRPPHGLGRIAFEWSAPCTQAFTESARSPHLISPA